MSFGADVAFKLAVGYAIFCVLSNIIGGIAIICIIANGGF